MDLSFDGSNVGGKYMLSFDWSLTIHLFTTPFSVYDLCHCVVSAERFDIDMLGLY